jgi:phage gp29-like protein
MPNTKRQTTYDNLNDLIRNLGGTPKFGATKADLLDQLETMLSGGGISPDDVKAIVAELLPDAIDESIQERIEPLIAQAVEDAIQTGSLDESDFDDIFNDGE